MPKQNKREKNQQQNQNQKIIVNQRGRKPKNNRGRPSLKQQKREIKASASRSRSRSWSRSRSRENQSRREEQYQINRLQSEESMAPVQVQSESEGGQSFEEVGLPSKNANNSQFQNAIRTIFIQFFSDCKHPNGFVFKNQERMKMIKDEVRKKQKNKLYKQIHWKETSQWQNAEEEQKVNKVFEDNSLNMSEETLKNMKDIFKNSSWMFADETTEELYLLEFQILKIAIQVKEEFQKERISYLMREILSGAEKWRFFSFNFSSLYRNKLESREAQTVYQKLGESLLSVIKQKL